jgi:hypothetical protein
LQLIQTFICQKKFELISGVLTPGRILDRNGKAIRCKLAGQYDGIDGAGTDVGGAVIVFRRFDDECHVGPTVGAAIVCRNAFVKRYSVKRYSVEKYSVNCSGTPHRIGSALAPRLPIYARGRSMIYWTKSHR